MRSKSLRIGAFFLIYVLSLGGCLGKLPYLTKGPYLKDSSVADQRNEPRVSPTDKAKAATESRLGTPSHEDSGLDHSKPSVSDLKSPSTSVPTPTTRKDSKKPQPSDEEEMIKARALDLAKTLGNVTKMKVCYMTKDTEWWAIFYEDIGTAIDVKQFIWNRELEKFDPFLVLKRFPKEKLGTELKAQEPGSICSVLVPPARTSGAVQ